MAVGRLSWPWIKPKEIKFPISSKTFPYNTPDWFLQISDNERSIAGAGVFTGIFKNIPAGSQAFFDYMQLFFENSQATVQMASIRITDVNNNYLCRLVQVMAAANSFNQVTVTFPFLVWLDEGQHLTAAKPVLADHIEWVVHGWLGSKQVLSSIKP